MHTRDLAAWTHDHVFDAGNPLGERRTRWVVALTASMMCVELAAGWIFRSMALLADGWHMSTHAAALGITALAYRLARRHAADARFAFGTWKIEVLGGFASGIVLVMVALYMAVASVRRLLDPLPIRYDQALAVAVLGLGVNLVSAWLLRERPHEHGVADAHRGGHEHGGAHEPGAGHAHGGGRHHHHADLNLRGAYLHVLADATTSVLAIAALLGGRMFGWRWLDALMGIAGAVIVTVWARGLLRDTARVLLDREMDAPVVSRIRELLESDGDTKVSDIHCWRVGRARFACAVSLVASAPEPAATHRRKLEAIEELAHVTVEVALCDGEFERRRDEER